MRTNLPRNIHQNETGIINLDDEDHAGTHWTAYKKYGTRIVFFDSFGNLQPPLEVKKYFNSNGYCKILYNHEAFQTYNSYNCGHLCLSFLYNK